MRPHFTNVSGAPGPDTLQAARQREIDNALLTQALCGRTVSSAVLAQLRRYVVGELPREQAFAGLYQP